MNPFEHGERGKNSKAVKKLLIVLIYNTITVWFSAIFRANIKTPLSFREGNFRRLVPLIIHAIYCNVQLCGDFSKDFRLEQTEINYTRYSIITPLRL